MSRIDRADGGGIPQPEPGLAPETLVARAAALRPMLRAAQDETDRRGHYSEEIHRAFVEAGLYRMLQPRRLGGYEVEFPWFLKAVIEISRGHPAAGWCFTLAASHALLVASHWPAEAQAELFGPAGEFRAPHRAAPAGQLRRAEGGWIVNGVWSYASGVPVATHFIGNSFAPGADGRPVPVIFIVPREAVEILADWGGDRSLGMQGSGSNSVRLTDVFVPDRHVTFHDVLRASDPSGAGTPGTALHGNPMYLGVVGGAYQATFGAIMTGAARAAAEEYEELIRTKAMMVDPATPRFKDPESQRPLGKALALADAAEAVTLAIGQAYMDQCRRWAADGTPITALETIRLWSMAQEACFLACEAVDLLFRSAPVVAANRGQRLQRYFRDIQMYRIHPSAQPWVALARGQGELGLPFALFGGRPEA